MFWSGALMLLGRHLRHTRIENNGTCSNWHVRCRVQEINTVTLKKKHTHTKENTAGLP